ncbi:hypothetical protein GPECTOR_108g168 [Gonium pectorale]|uniref:Uncharacterized protein n=1 Tax=Gonium pectorale TaxID=33097 RepID=A0A150FZD1_GONPE|nr:hypothetical protein GPECTOR_108g168 [Gonium pectorale]|eukprot:KXZ42973.1 hypothetical protein GPECTOR_108g168 [Gonium pectorale]
MRSLIYLKGAAAVTNLIGQYTVHNGFWGDWLDWKYCTSIANINQVGSAIRAAKVVGFRLRTEANQGGGDDTALNGIE